MLTHVRNSLSMPRLVGLTSALAVLLTMMSLCGTALGSTMGGIQGKVVDQVTGDPIIGAPVTVLSENIRNNGITALSDLNGVFLISNLVAGEVTLVVKMFPFTDYSQKVFITQGTTTRKDIKLIEPGGEVIIEEVYVPGAAPIIDFDTAGRTTSFDQKEVAELPIRGNSFQSLVALTPGVTTDADGGIHIGGGRESEVGWQVDGVSVTDPVTGTFGTNLNLNAIESMQVITGGFSAEYGQAMSGIVNVVTKSGGNDFHGGVTLRYMNNEIDEAIFGEGKRYRRYERKRLGLYEKIQRLGPNDYEEVPSVRHYDFSPEFFLEGPIIKDKVTFFTGFDITNATRQNYWTQSARTWEGFNGNGKLTYRVTPDDSLVFSFTKSRAEIGYDGLRWLQKESRPSQTQDTGNYTIKYAHIFNATTNIEVNFQFFDQFLRFSPTDEPGKAYPYEFAIILAPNPSSPVWDQIRRFYDPNIRGLEDLDQDQLYLSGDFYRYYKRNVYRKMANTKFETRLGRNHFVKMGVEFADVLYNDQDVWTGYRYYIYQGGKWVFDTNTQRNGGYSGDGNPLTANNRARLPGYYELRREANWPGSNWNGSDFHKLRTNSQNYTMFLNDQWSPISTLTINAGIRVDVLDVQVPRLRTTPDYPEYPSSVTGGQVAPPRPANPPAVNSTLLRRNDFQTIDISPRVSLSYSPSNDLRMFANYGIFYNTTALDNAIRSDETSSYQYRFYGQWNQWVWEEYAPEDIRSEKTYFYQIGFDKAFGSSQLWGLQITGTWKEQDDLFSQVELSNYRGTQTFNSVRNIGDAAYWGVDIAVRRRLANNWQARFSYTYSQALGSLDYFDYLTYGENFIGESPNVGDFYPLEWDVPHVAKATLLYEIPRVKGLQVSAVYSYESGFPYTEFYRTVQAGNWITINATTKNAKRLPDRNHLDITFSYDWRITERYGLKTFISFYNVFNNYNILEAYDGNGAAISVARRRYVELGLSYRF